MLSGIRAIFYQTELEYPPLQDIAITKDQIANLFSTMRKPGGHPYEVVDLQAEKPFLATCKDRGESRCEFGRNSIRIQESHSGMTADEFAGVVTTVIRGIGDDCPPFFLQRCKIHCLAQPSNSGGSVELLAGRVSNVFDKSDAFGRWPSFFGVRFRFLPSDVIRERLLAEQDERPDEPKSENSDEQSESQVADGVEPGADNLGLTEFPADDQWKGYVTVRFESYSEDISQVWIEVAATYPVMTFIRRKDMGLIATNIIETHRFATEKCKAFLDQFDRPDPENH